MSLVLLPPLSASCIPQGQSPSFHLLPTPWCSAQLTRATQLRPEPSETRSLSKPFLAFKLSMLCVYSKNSGWRSPPFLFSARTLNHAVQDSLELLTLLQNRVHVPASLISVRAYLIAVYCQNYSPFPKFVLFKNCDLSHPSSV